ncbi:hypothetical protein EDD15DRAFT_2193834 [Pisolithus albus]|nr:hypothetical protein EDD15DRAFT_2193834 [Pisolithus albus]
MHYLLASNGSSEYYITSVEREWYLGDAGCFNPHLIVVLDPGVQSPKFTVTAVSGDNTYTIKVNGLFIRGQDDLVYSFGDGSAEEWVIIPREADGAYTVQREADNTAWTTPRPNIPDPLQVWHSGACLAFGGTYRDVFPADSP